LVSVRILRTVCGLLSTITADVQRVIEPTDLDAAHPES
jgi:hypothetical protein